MMQSQPLETRLFGSFRVRLAQEFFGNSAQFPIVNILLELLLEQAGQYVRSPSLYVLLAVSFCQAWLLTRWQTTPHPRRWLGNLIGPAIYTIIELGLEGGEFWQAPQHWAYWGFSLAIGLLQTVGQRPRPVWLSAGALWLETVTRFSIPLVMYGIFEMLTTPETNSLTRFFGDNSHVFITLAVLLLGVSAGLTAITAEHYLRLLKHTSAQLQTYSEWLLGRDLLAQLVANPNALTLTRRARTVLFMDIRGFTRWSEQHPPEAVVGLLNRYYQVAETQLDAHHIIKFKFSADEVLAVFAQAADATAAARALQQQMAALLAPHALGVGLGLHTGPLVEGLLGSAGVKFYDVIGDTVNTAKRLESAASAGETLLSATTCEALGQPATPPLRHIAAKGKEAPIPVWALE